MKSKSILTISVVVVLLLILSACGAKAIPTTDPAFVQASAVAAANTMLAMTQAAMPTETLISPPTTTLPDTPQPVPTIPPLPTNPVLISPVLPSPTAVTSSASGSSGGECSGTIKTSKGENLATITINNKTNVLLGLSLYLNKNSWGDCGFWSSPAGISPNSSITLTSLPASNSCYHVTAWTLTGKPSFMNGNNFCVGINSTHYTINVTTSSISFP